MDIKTYNDVYLNARKKLRLAGCEASDAEARLIVTTAAVKTIEQFMRDRHLYVTDMEFDASVEQMLARRLEGEPIAYILGEWEFYGLPITVNRDVLIPRVDTEVLAETVINLYKEKLGGTRVLDLCAGTGCIGLAVAAHVPFCRVILADKSMKALQISRTNTRRNNLSRAVSSMELDALQDPPLLLGRFDVIVANPPYIPTADIDQLDTSVRSFEPIVALNGGTDGLDFYRSITSKWKTVLKENGRLAFECGVGQAEGVREIMDENGFTDITFVKDTLNIDRVVIGTASN